MAYLVEIALGPVQGFIAAGRNTRDLAFGSWMLQDISRQVAKELHELQFTLVFPTDQSRASTNKLMAIAPKNMNADMLVYALRQVEDRVRGYVKNSASSLFSQLPNPNPSTVDSLHIDRALWQINDIIEFYWGCVEYNEPNYAQAVIDVQNEVAARKNSRLFEPNQYADTVLKSSLTGTYESVIHKNLYPTESDSLYRRYQKLEKLANVYGIVGAEQLSGIDVLKRKATNSSFKPISTAAIAARGMVLHMPPTVRSAFDSFWQSTFGYNFMQSSSENQELLVIGVDDILERLRAYAVEAFDGLSKDDINQWWQPIDAMIRGRTQGNSFDISEFFACLYAPVRDIYLHNQSNTSRQNIETHINNLLNHFNLSNHFREYRREDANHLMVAGYALLHKIDVNPYFAVIVADGDHMGQTIATIARHSVKAHQDFSDTMWQFASDVRTYVEGYYGTAVYAGGDDFLVFVPVSNAIDCAERLKNEFESCMQRVLSGYGLTTRVTLSMGIVVAHYQDSLNETMRNVREAEKNAKKLRNAVSIRIAKRSGSVRDITGQDDFISRIRNLSMLWRTNRIPHGYPYEIQSLLQRYFAGNVPQNPAYTDERILKLQIKRISSRKQVDYAQVESTVGPNPDVKRWLEWSNEVLIASEL